MSRLGRTPTILKLGVALVLGAVGGVLVGIIYRLAYAPIVGWGIAALLFELWIWRSVGGMDATETRAHATREDPSRAAADVLLLAANVASLAAVGYVVLDAGRSAGLARIVLGAVALTSVAVSWVLVQTLFTLRYARLYYADRPGGIDFNPPDHDQQDPPTYADFAYLAFTMGMTYQVSDTNLQTKQFRAAVLRHGLLSYIFGTVILATTVNLVVGLSSR